MEIACCESQLKGGGNALMQIYVLEAFPTNIKNKMNRTSSREAKARRSPLKRVGYCLYTLLYHKH